MAKNTIAKRRKEEEMKTEKELHEKENDKGAQQWAGERKTASIPKAIDINIAIAYIVV